MPPFADLDPTPAGHFALRVYALVADLLVTAEEGLAVEGGPAAAFPFPAGYAAELDRRGLTGRGPGWWAGAVADWERAVPGRLPLRDAGLDPESVRVLLAVGLVEEDARFGAVFDALQGMPLGRPTWGWVEAWRRSRGRPGARGRLRALRDAGWIGTVNPDARRAPGCRGCRRPCGTRSAATPATSPRPDWRGRRGRRCPTSPTWHYPTRPARRWPVPRTR